MRTTIAVEPLKVLKNARLLEYIKGAKYVFLMDEHTLKYKRTTKTEAVVHVLAAEHKIDFSYGNNLYIII